VKAETNTGTDGVRTDNDEVNSVEIRWGKVQRVAIYTDTARLTRTLDVWPPQVIQMLTCPRLSILEQRVEWLP